MIENWKNILVSLFLLSLLFPGLMHGDEEIGKHTKIGAQLYLKTDQDLELTEYYSAGARLKLKIRPEDDWKFHVELDASHDGVALDEMWGRYSYDESTLKFGVFENSFLIDDHLNSREYPFATDSYLRERMDEMGWYSDNSVGINYMRPSSRGLRAAVGYGELFYISNSSEIMFLGGASYPWAGKYSFCGISAVYYPHVFHDLWGDSSLSLSSSSHTDGYYEDHYGLVNLFFGDLTEKNLLIYKVELTTGTNLVDPIGYLGYPGDGDEFSLFMGADAFIGHIVDAGDFEWTPSLNGGVYIHSLEKPECNAVTVKIGNRFNWHNDFYIHFDLGVEIDTYYQSEDGDLKLMTSLEELWGIKLLYVF